MAQWQRFSACIVGHRCSAAYRFRVQSSTCGSRAETTDTEPYSTRPAAQWRAGCMRWPGSSERSRRARAFSAASILIRSAGHDQPKAQRLLGVVQSTGDSGCSRHDALCTACFRSAGACLAGQWQLRKAKQAPVPDSPRRLLSAARCNKDTDVLAGDACLHACVRLPLGW